MAAAGPRGQRTTLAQCLSIVIWLENKKNFAIMDGSASSGTIPVHGTPLKKIDGMKSLCEHLKKPEHAGGADTIWDVATTKVR